MAYADIFAGALAVYRMNESSGQPQDTSGNANHGTNATDLTYSVASINGITADTCITFNGSTSLFNIPVSLFDTVDGPEQGKHVLAVSFWAKWTTVGSSDTMISAGNTGTNTPYFQIGSGTSNPDRLKVSVSLRDSASNSQIDHSTDTLWDDSAAHHVVIQFLNQRYWIWIDGVLDTDYGLWTPNSPGATSLNVATIGCLGRTANTQHAAVTLQDLAIWDRTLRDEEIAALNTGTPAAAESFTLTWDNPILLRHTTVGSPHSRDITFSHPGGDLGVSVTGWGSDVGEAYSIELDTEGANDYLFEENIGQDLSGWHEAGTIFQNVAAGSHTIKVRPAANSSSAAGNFEWVGIALRAEHPFSGCVAQSSQLFTEPASCMYGGDHYRIFSELFTGGHIVCKNSDGANSVRLNNGNSANYQDRWHQNCIALTHPDGVVFVTNYHGNGQLTLYMAPGGDLNNITSYLPGTTNSTYLHGAVLNDGTVAILTREGSNCGLWLVTDPFGTPADTSDIVFANTADVRMYPIKLQHIPEAGNGSELLCIAVNRRDATGTQRWVSLTGAVYDVAADLWYSIDKAVTSGASKGTAGVPRFSIAQEEALLGSSGCMWLAEQGATANHNRYMLNAGSCIFNAENWDTNVTAFFVFNDTIASGNNAYGAISGRTWYRFVGGSGTAWADGGGVAPDLASSVHFAENCCLIPKDGDTTNNTAYCIYAERGTRQVTTYLNEEYTPYLDSWSGRTLYLYQIDNVFSGTPAWTLLDTRSVSNSFMEGWINRIDGKDNAFTFCGQTAENHEHVRQEIPYITTNAGSGFNIVDSLGGSSGFGMGGLRFSPYAPRRRP